MTANSKYTEQIPVHVETTIVYLPEKHLDMER